MRIISYFVNSTLLCIYVILIAPITLFFSASHKMQETKLYGQNLINIDFSNGEISLAMFKLLFSLSFLLPFILGLYSSYSDKKFDQKIIFSKKGFFINSCLSLIILLLLSAGLARDEDHQSKLKITQEIFDSLEMQNTFVFPIPRFESSTSFLKRLNDVQGKDMNQLLDAEYQDECSQSPIANYMADTMIDIHFYDEWRFLVVSQDAIDVTIERYNESQKTYKIDNGRCRLRELAAQDEYVKSLPKSSGVYTEKDRKTADMICNAANDTSKGC